MFFNYLIYVIIIFVLVRSHLVAICVRAMGGPGGYSPARRQAYNALRRRIRVVAHVPWGGAGHCNVAITDTARRSSVIIYLLF